ncbi:eukaryotic translation initiation factor 2 beta [Pyrrhoderma noxium]|uniref:Eukaryotic translation initiation factor 2 beta n=1 Tax=Pyrrhoderma noxium TaxID=2282107 RepID=A0A286UEZ2_9AGAM|nr:eukaryotic translation initiation factor 2 beta [Pyrrhoderma noxium]
MASEEPLFDPSLKKKKKKKTVAFTEDPLGADADPTTPAPLEDDDAPTAHERMKQSDLEKDNEAKKKKKKEIPMDLGEEGSGTSTPAEAPADDLDFSDIKKKKKKKVPLDLDLDSGTSTPVDGSAPAATGATPGDDFDFSDLKKKKKTSKKKAAFDLEAFEKELGDAQGEDADGAHLDNLDEGELGDDVFAAGGEERRVDNEEPWLGSDRDYIYPELLHRFYSLLHAAHPSLLSSIGKRYTIAPPQILREGNKKTVFANVGDICKRMHRSPEHVIQFMFAEMGTNGSVDGSGRLVIKGRFQQKQVENVLRRYIVEYVTCKTCKSPDTVLTKENRIFFVSCESCGSRRSVNTIKSGFQAQVGRRSKNKAA